MDSTERHRYLVAAEAAGAGVAEEEAEEAEVKPLEVAPVWVNLPGGGVWLGIGEGEVSGLFEGDGLGRAPTSVGTDVPLPCFGVAEVTVA